MNAMNLRDRRAPSTGIVVQRRIGLTRRQAQTLSDCERFGWKLAFVREPLEVAVPVLFATADSFVLVRLDGSIDLNPDIEVRQIGVGHCLDTAVQAVSGQRPSTV
ncbi:MAG TPA: hypothetical protein VIT66_07090 [Lysobacter sp.]